MSRAVIAESATKASEMAKEFISTGGTMVSRARMLVSGDAQFFTVQPKVEDLRRYLQSDSVHDKRDAMKRIIAQMCKGHDMSNLFADVVKNIHAPSIELRKLIYFYIAHYAEDRPNEALLSISAFQKDLLDPSMHVRSLALRMLSSIRIPAIHPIVMVAVKKCATDLEYLVRKTAAISLAQMHAVSGDDGDAATTRELLQQLLADKCIDVSAAAALSFVEICPDDVSFIHRVYRDLCRSLQDCEEWGQVVLVHVLLHYARTQFTDPNGSFRAPSKTMENSKDLVNRNKNGFDNNNEEEAEGEEKGTNKKESSSSSSSFSSSSSSSSPLSSSTRTSLFHRDEPIKQLAADVEVLLDNDHRLLLDSVRPLFMSMNSAVVIAATSLFYHCAPRRDLDICVQPLLRLLGGPDEQHALILSVIHTIVLTTPEPFGAFIKEFFILPNDVKDVRELKFRIIARLITHENFSDVFRECRSYVRSFYVDRVVEAVHGLGLIAAHLTGCATQIMRLLVPLLSHKVSDVVSESVSVLRLLVVQGTDKIQTCRLVYRLLQQVMQDEIEGSSAKASILWLVGENLQLHPAIASVAPDCFRVFVKKFTGQTTEVKKQVLMLGCKIWLFLDGSSEMAERFRRLFFYALELARFDDDYNVRDRGRLIECAVDRQSATFEALKSTLLSEKPLPLANDPYVERTQYQIGTMSHLFGNTLFAYRELLEWPEEMPDPTVRGVDCAVEGSLSGTSSDATSSFSSSVYSDESHSSFSASSSYSSKSSQQANSESGEEDEEEDEEEVEKISDAGGSVSGTTAGQQKDMTVTTTTRVPVNVVVRQVNSLHVDPNSQGGASTLPTSAAPEDMRKDDEGIQDEPTHAEGNNDNDSDKGSPHREDYAPPLLEKKTTAPLEAVEVVNTSVTVTNSSALMDEW